MAAVAHAHKILDWFEHLMPNEVPPEWMWPFDDLLEEWFEDVMAARKSGMGMDDEDDETFQNELSPRYRKAG